MNVWLKIARGVLVAIALTLLAGCEDPQVYGSVGISSGYSSYGGHGWGGSGIRTSISIGGRIR